MVPEEALLNPDAQPEGQTQQLIELDAEFERRLAAIDEDLAQLLSELHGARSPPVRATCQCAKARGLTAGLATLLPCRSMRAASRISHMCRPRVDESIQG